MAEANPANQQAQFSQLRETPAAIEPEDREYRKGNWTLRETVVLNAAKKRDEDRRLKGGEKEKSKPAELRWKWVGNYCWKNGCQRNLNQCNDKWDNLLRDYKKVRDYELRSTAAAADPRHREQPMISSYWQMEKHERMEKGLPSNLLKRVYQALHDVIDRRFPPPASKLPQSDFPAPALPSTSMRPAATFPRSTQQPPAQQSTAAAPILSGIFLSIRLQFNHLMPV